MIEDSTTVSIASIGALNAAFMDGLSLGQVESVALHMRSFTLIAKKGRYKLMRRTGLFRVHVLVEDLLIKCALIQQL